MSTEGNPSEKHVRYTQKSLRPTRQGGYVAQGRVKAGQRSKVIEASGATPMEALIALSEAVEKWVNNE